jgi:hypothetical protein
MEDPQKVTVAQACGESFARAIAGKDAGALCAVLAETIDFQALTPRRHWQASANTEVCRGDHPRNLVRRRSHRRTVRILLGPGRAARTSLTG